MLLFGYHKNLFLKKEASSKYPKIKPFKNNPLYDMLIVAQAAQFLLSVISK